jgi:pimeloyl-CoA dehydrogenase small subunit
MGEEQKMDFDLTDDQRLLQESMSKLLTARYGDFELRKQYGRQPDRFDRAIWAEYAEQGILGLNFAEDEGGFGGGPVETMIVMEEFGRALALEPYLTSVILCGEILKAAGDSMREEIIPAVVSGTKILALAQTERGARFDLHDVSLAARRDGGDYVLEGEKSVVIGGGAADALIVSARTAGDRRDTDGITLFLVDGKAPGVSRRVYPTQDGQQAAEVSFGQVRVPATAVIGAAGDGLKLLQKGVDVAIAGLCAEAVGAMDALVKLTVEYMKTRKQFGVPIASFQALQHRTVDMLVMLEQARSMAVYAALMAEEPDETVRHQAIAAAKIQIGRSAKFIGQQATQLHGGIGMTMEYKGGHYFKRLTAIEQAFGDADHHLRALAAAGAAIAA